MIFNRKYRGWPRGYQLKPGDVSDAQLSLLKKRGVLDYDGPSGASEKLTIPEVRDKVSSMGIEESYLFMRGDKRKGVQKIRDDLVRS